MRRHSGFLGLVNNPALSIKVLPFGLSPSTCSAQPACLIPVPISGRGRSSLSPRERVGVRGLDQRAAFIFSPSPYPLPKGEGFYAAGYRDFGISYWAPHTEAAWTP